MLPQPLRLRLRRRLQADSVAWATSPRCSARSRRRPWHRVRRSCAPRARPLRMCGPPPRPRRRPRRRHRLHRRLHLRRSRRLRRRHRPRQGPLPRPRRTHRQRPHPPLRPRQRHFANRAATRCGGRHRRLAILRFEARHLRAGGSTARTAQRASGTAVGRSRTASALFAPWAASTSAPPSLPSAAARARLASSEATSPTPGSSPRPARSANRDVSPRPLGPPRVSRARRANTKRAAAKSRAPSAQSGVRKRRSAGCAARRAPAATL